MATQEMGDGRKLAVARTLLGAKIRFETTKGTFEVVTFPKEAPKHVEQILALVKKGFYKGD